MHVSFGALRSLPVVALAFFGALGPRSALATGEGDKRVCASAYEQGQRLRRQGQLRLARQELQQCARDVCNAVIRQECAQWVGELDKAVPSVVLRARDAEDRDMPDVRVVLDGKPFLERLDGRAVEVDPGQHVFRFEREGLPPAEASVLVSEAEKARSVSVRLAAKPQTEAETKTTLAPVPWPAYALGGVAAVGLGSFAYFGSKGRAQYTELLACRGHCSQASVDSVRQKFLLADVSLGLSIVAIGIATYLVVSRPNISVSTPVIAARVEKNGGRIELFGAF